MNKENKQRVIGKVVAINSDRFTVELLGGIDNFNIIGYDDIHYFARLNSYIIVPYQNYYIVAEVSGVRERDQNTNVNNPTEQNWNKLSSGKFLDVLPIGTLNPQKIHSNEYEFNFGVSVYPALYSDVLYIKENELDAIFNVSDNSVEVDNSEDETKKFRYKTLSIGKSTVFQEYDVKINIDKFFGSHSAILGNTGSGKSCTISAMIQNLYKYKNFSATGSTFIFLDVNGEYQQAFSELPNLNGDIDVRTFTFDEDKVNENNELLKLPHWFLNIDEWALLLQASEKTQLPMLRNALGLAALFSRDDTEEKKKTKNHILATCITQILRDETSSPSKKDRITAILQKFRTEDINLDKRFQLLENGRPKTTVSYNNTHLELTIRNCIFVYFGGMIGEKELLLYLESKDHNDELVFLSDRFKMPVYKHENKFIFNSLEDAVDLAILYEEANGNRQIRDYCSSLITRLVSLKDRPDFNFLKQDEGEANSFQQQMLGIKTNEDGNIKCSQVTILDISSLEDEIIEVISCVFARMLYQKIKTLEPRNKFPVNLILEEAHRYIGDDTQRSFYRANKIFERIAKEGRKFGFFLLISSQRPSELSRTVLSQCSNFIVHRIQNPEDLAHIRQITPHISETILRRLPSIPTQHALIFGHSVNLPSTFKVSTADPLPKSENNKVSENWFKLKDHKIDVQ